MSITGPEECKTAAETLGYFGTLQQVRDTSRPSGCSVGKGPMDKCTPEMELGCQLKYYPLEPIQILWMILKYWLHLLDGVVPFYRAFKYMSLLDYI